MLAYLLILITVLNGINCIEYNDFTARIIGGRNVTDRKLVPYQASIRVGNRSLCGAAILNERYVLTSADCFNRNNLTKMQVVVGDIALNQKKNINVTQIESVKIHEKYSRGNTSNYDLALVKVKTPFVFSELVQPLDVWLNKWTPTKTCNISGYGHNGTTAVNLESVDVYISLTNYCNKTYKIPEGEFCAGNTRKDGRYGDQGSPLVCDNKLLGIRSAEGIFGEAGSGIYLNITYFNSWIIKNMRGGGGGGGGGGGNGSATTLATSLLTLFITLILAVL